MWEVSFHSFNLVQYELRRYKYAKGWLGFIVSIMAMLAHLGSFRYKKKKIKEIQYIYGILILICYRVYGMLSELRLY